MDEVVQFSFVFCCLGNRAKLLMKAGGHNWWQCCQTCFRSRTSSNLDLDHYLILNEGHRIATFSIAVVVVVGDVVVAVDVVVSIR